LNLIWAKVQSVKHSQNVVTFVRMKGLGDTIDRITRITGVKAIVKAITGQEECVQCSQKKDKLNKKFPYGTDTSRG
jgi:hypothetical protein